ncbi:extracellular matrix regulatory protein B [Cytobacillus horneckiae]|uniref:DUF370 domain-containing protein n=1 Tax=Cytobacillus horneckiae TaxID=549687 RepID=A0A2N0Z8P0_9BACI|nr:DUF370 domain-containing protein [Cytobacillus horneckiae]NRG43368.1 DUF370 domain-containing protein [Bacillus sp. CRN 9]MBN6889947.1 DUF370 domain-containing protein [Cytobacillus horneckiae]MCM3179437.1 DUF370 domain-containing protein [Cytobacillus horneckiae]MEC1157762.1 DUF370 domain-containing protein [Cytobacillus horneckiae]MED2938068.1 DUF370 domain-containing protein [Cytobacillus horneckiae]
MYIHIGEDVLIRAKDLVAIIDKESASSSMNTEEFLQREEGLIINLAKGHYKSVVITTDQIYYSPLASATLKKRTAKLSVHEF